MFLSNFSPHNYSFKFIIFIINYSFNLLYVGQLGLTLWKANILEYPYKQESIQAVSKEN